MSRPRGRRPQGVPGSRTPHGERMRLNRYLALCGATSRRDAMALVFASRVEVNGTIVRDPGHEIVCGRDQVVFDGELVRPPRRWLYYAFHKPRGVVVTAHDELGREGLVPFLRRIPQRVYPVGRLDRASEGLLLLTNHGELGQRLLHPSCAVEKVYRVTVTPRPTRRMVAEMAAGVDLGRGERSAPAGVRVRRGRRDGALLSVTLHEGKKREVRRICRAVGLRVLQLRRVSFGGILLGGLRPGALRPLTRGEIAHLRNLTNLEL